MRLPRARIPGFEDWLGPREPVEGKLDFTRHAAESQTKGETTVPVHKGRTEDAGGIILGAKFWRKGTSIRGVVMRKFPTANGPCYAIEMPEEISVSGDSVSPPQKGTLRTKQVAVGNMKGFLMAVNASGVSDLLLGDVVVITCTGSKPSGKASPLVTFDVEIHRADKARTDW